MAPRGTAAAAARDDRKNVRRPNLVWFMVNSFLLSVTWNFDTHAAKLLRRAVAGIKFIIMPPLLLAGTRRHVLKRFALRLRFTIALHFTTLSFC